MYTIELNTIREAMNQLEDKCKELLCDKLEDDLMNDMCDNEEVWANIEDLTNCVERMVDNLVDFESNLSEAEDANEKLGV